MICGFVTLPKNLYQKNQYKMQLSAHLKSINRVVCDSPVSKSLALVGKFFDFGSNETEHSARQHLWLQTQLQRRPLERK